MNPESARRVVDAYCASFPKQVTDLADTLSGAGTNPHAISQAVSEIAAQAHRMAGTAHCMGFTGLGNHLMQLEDEAERLAAAGADCPASAVSLATQIKFIAGLKSQVTRENSHLLQRRADDEILTIVEEARPQSTAELIARQRVLYADDDGAMRTLVRALLADMGVRQTQIAKSGQEALDLAARFDPTIMILDWMMEPMNGLEVLTAIRNGSTVLSTDTKIIFLTAQNSADDVRQVIRRGGDHFLVKPFNQDILTRAVIKVAMARR